MGWGGGGKGPRLSWALNRVPPPPALFRSGPRGTSTTRGMPASCCALPWRVSPPSRCVVWARSPLKAPRLTHRKCSVNISHVLLLIIKCLKSWRGLEGPFKHDSWLFGWGAGCLEASAQQPAKEGSCLFSSLPGFRSKLQGQPVPRALPRPPTCSSRGLCPSSFGIRCSRENRSQESQDLAP